MDEASKEGGGQVRPACAECQRRKQKCNREWPCNHCQKRKVADKCRFNAPIAGPEKSPQDAKKGVQAIHPAFDHGGQNRQDTAATEPQTLAIRKEKKRQLSQDDHNGGDSNNDDDDDDLGIASIGYMANNQFARLGISGKMEKRTPRLFLAKASANAYLQRALEILPERPHMDAMVQNFFDNVNYHYYIIYPPVFLQEYKEWWVHRKQGSVLSLQWTCLLLTVCSCACQHLPVDVQGKLENEIGETASQLSERYHNMARELASAIPVGYYHMHNVQWLLHSTYWFKAEARFLECWHVLGAAAREAQELSFHKKEAAEHLSEFDREMRRRVWCVIDCWDWQISSGLFRPTIIDHTDCTVELPTLTLEDFSPSPLMHMKLQSELIHQLAAKFGAPKNISSTQDVKVYKKIIDDWMQRFPPAYALHDPDTSGDEERPWIRFHRHYIHTMGYMMLLNPIRSFMAVTFTADSHKDELDIRAIGVDYALKEMDVLRDWVDFVSYRDGRFHFIIFSLFDTSAVLSTALIKDEGGTIPNRNEIYKMIDGAVAMLKNLMMLSPTAKMSYDILSRIVRKVPRPAYLAHEASRRTAFRVGVQVPLFQATSTSPPAPPPVIMARSVPELDHQSMPISSIQVPVQPPLPPSPLVESGSLAPIQSSIHAPSHTGVHVPVQPMLYAPVHALVQAPVQPPLPTSIPTPMTYLSQAPGPAHSAFAPSPMIYEAAPLGHLPSLDTTHCLKLQTNGSIPLSGHAGMPCVPSNHHHEANIAAQPSIFQPMSQEQSDQEGQFDRITDEDLGALATLWNWQSLKLPFIGSERSA